MEICWNPIWNPSQTGAVFGQCEIAIASFRLSAASGFGLFGIHKLLRPSDIVHLGRRIGTEMNWIEDAVTIVHYCQTFFIFGNLAQTFNQINPMPVWPQSMQARWSTLLLQDSKGMARVKECKPPSFAKQDSSMSHTCYHHLLSLNIFIIYNYNQLYIRIITYIYIPTVELTAKDHIQLQRGRFFWLTSPTSCSCRRWTRVKPSVDNARRPSPATWQLGQTSSFKAAHLSANTCMWPVASTSTGLLVHLSSTTVESNRKMSWAWKRICGSKMFIRVFSLQVSFVYSRAFTHDNSSILHPDNLGSENITCLEKSERILCIRMHHESICWFKPLAVSTGRLRQLSEAYLALAAGLVFVTTWQFGCHRYGGRSMQMWGRRFHQCNRKPMREWSNSANDKRQTSGVFGFGPFPCCIVHHNDSEYIWPRSCCASRLETAF